MVKLLKSLTSLMSASAVLRLLKTYFTAAIPETMPSFFAIFLFIAAARGARSASTKLPAKELVSIPEPAPNLLATLGLVALVEVEDEVAGGVAVVEEIEVAIRSLLIR